MEFWGSEVKSGEPLLVHPGEGMVLHLSQACLGEVKEKGNESVCLFVSVDGKKLVLGTLAPEKLPQQIFDLVFDRSFELSHNWKNGSVYFYGYRASNPYDDSEDESDFDSEDGLPVNLPNNGKQEKLAKPNAPEKANAVKESAAGKQKVKIVEPNKGVKVVDSDDSDSDDDDLDVPMYPNESDTSDTDQDDESDDDDEDGDSDEEDDETPVKKAETSKKRSLESASKTPVTDKKAKTVTPQRTDGKKAHAHEDTPHPSKKGGKTAANKSNQKTPKSGGSHHCKPCDRTFQSENALESHTKAKHSAGK